MADEQFTYEINGDTVTLPYLKKIKMGSMRKIRRLRGDDQFFTLLEEIADEDTLAVIDELDGDQLAELLDAWQKESGVTLGESAASSTS